MWPQCPKVLWLKNLCLNPCDQNTSGQKYIGQKSSGQKSSGLKFSGQKSSGQKLCSLRSCGQKSTGQKSCGREEHESWFLEIFLSTFKILDRGVALLCFNARAENFSIMIIIFSFLGRKFAYCKGSEKIIATFNHHIASMRTGGTF